MDSIRLYEADIRKRLTPAKAEFLFENFEVIAKNKRDISGSGLGFDATVWRGRANSAYAGQIYISLRALEPQDGGVGLHADASHAAYESSYNQVRDMVNWWMRVTAEPGKLTGQIGVDFTARPTLADSFVFAIDTPAIATGELYDQLNTDDGADARGPTGDAEKTK